MLVSSRVLLDNRQFYIKEFDSNYYYNFKSDYRFFKFIEYYVRTRIFDMKIFKKDMENIRNTVDIENLPGYKRLLTEEYWKISDDEFEKVIKSIIEDVKAGNIALIDIVKIYAYFSYFVKKGLIDYDIKTLKSVFLNGMNIASLKSEYCANVEEELAKIAVDNWKDDMEEILQHFNNLNMQLLEKQYKEKAEEIFKCIPMKMEQFYERFDKECMDIPIFKYYDVFQLFQRISCASNEDIVIIKEKMLNRAIKNAKKLQPEIKNLEQLKQVLDNYLNGKETTIKMVMLRDFTKNLGYIIEQYNEDQKIKSK